MRVVCAPGDAETEALVTPLEGNVLSFPLVLAAIGESLVYDVRHADVILVIEGPGIRPRPQWGRIPRPPLGSRNVIIVQIVSADVVVVYERPILVLVLVLLAPCCPFPPVALALSRAAPPAAEEILAGVGPAGPGTHVLQQVALLFVPALIARPGGGGLFHVAHGRDVCVFEVADHHVAGVPVLGLRAAVIADIGQAVGGPPGVPDLDPFVPAHGVTDVRGGIPTLALVTTLAGEVVRFPSGVGHHFDDTDCTEALLTLHLFFFFLIPAQQSHFLLEISHLLNSTNIYFSLRG